MAIAYDKEETAELPAVCFTIENLPDIAAA